MRESFPSIFKFVIAAGAVLTPIYSVMIVVVVLICIDFFTGVYAAFRRKDLISSRKIGNTVAKLLLLNLAVMSGFLIETYIVPEVPWVKVIAGFVAVVELTSIVENVNKATGINIMTAIKDFVSRYIPEEEFKEKFQNEEEDDSRRSEQDI